MVTMVWFLNILLTIWLFSEGTAVLLCPLFDIQLESEALTISNSFLTNENFVFGLPKNCSGELTGFSYCFSFNGTNSIGNLTVQLSLASVEREMDSYSINAPVPIFDLNFTIIDDEKSCSGKYCCRQEKKEPSVPLGTPPTGQQYLFEVIVDGIGILEYKESPQPPGWSASIPGASFMESQGTFNGATPSHKLIQFIFQERTETVSTMDAAGFNDTSNTMASSFFTTDSTVPPATDTSTSNSTMPTTESSNTTPALVPTSSTGALSSSEEDATLSSSSLNTAVFTVTSVTVFLVVTIPAVIIAFIIRRRECRRRAREYNLREEAKHSVHKHTGSRAMNREMIMNDSFEMSNNLEGIYHEIHEPHIYQIVQQAQPEPEDLSQIYDEPCVITQNPEPYHIEPLNYAEPTVSSPEPVMDPAQSQPYEAPHVDMLRVQSQPYEEPRQSLSQLREELASDTNNTDLEESSANEFPQIYEDPIASSHFPEKEKESMPYDVTHHTKLPKTPSREQLLQDTDYSTLNEPRQPQPRQPQPRQPQPYEDSGIIIFNIAHQTPVESTQEAMIEEESTGNTRDTPEPKRRHALQRSHTLQEPSDQEKTEAPTSTTCLILKT